MAESTKRYAVVTGSNKGIGLETVRQLAANGITVVLTARDEKRGLEAVEKLKQSGLSGQVVFHQLDVADPSSIASLANFVKTQFGKLDILVNNAGIGGSIIDADGFKAQSESGAVARGQIDWKKLLKNITSDWAKGVLSTDAENLREESVDDVVTEFLKDFKESLLESKGWPSTMSGYIVSKAAMNAYTRILANKYPGFRVNSVCPGYVKTDINFNTGVLPVEEGAASLVKLALLPNDGPTGQFFVRSEVSCL
ncbi:hypothetical protein M0R45_002084 [Rubus argutus]|uniref:Uncharacterized protein n=1 Tax=Rubus argutus TaxID=59490 RepID=A0AAW1VDC0_RUBAR